MRYCGGHRVKQRDGRHLRDAIFVDATDKLLTVFLGLNHRLGDGPPLLFETMIFGGPLHGSHWRYVSWDDAETGHAAALRKARYAVGPA